MLQHMNIGSGNDPRILNLFVPYDQFGNPVFLVLMLLRKPWWLLTFAFLEQVESSQLTELSKGRAYG